VAVTKIPKLDYSAAELERAIYEVGCVKESLLMVITSDDCRCNGETLKRPARDCYECIHTDLEHRVGRAAIFIQDRRTTLSERRLRLAYWHLCTSGGLVLRP
jgi:hypothetical protein